MAYKNKNGTIIKITREQPHGVNILPTTTIRCVLLGYKVLRYRTDFALGGCFLWAIPPPPYSNIRLKISSCMPEIFPRGLVKKKKKNPKTKENGKENKDSTGNFVNRP